MIRSIISILVVVFCAACAQGQAATKIEVTANDQMKFSVKRIEAQVGKTLEITIRNIGKLPKASMAHNFVILKPGSSLLTIAAKCHKAKEQNYIAPDAETRAAIVTSGKLLGPGESCIVRFTPQTSGDYPFLCTFPGHCTEMNGIIHVP
jgi:azurin